MDAYILLHGKHSGNRENHTLFQLSNELLEHGLVDYQAYAWSELDNKCYHNRFETCKDQIDSAIVDLKSQGATRIFLIGHSMGANAALYYISQQVNSVDGVVLLSPAHNVHLPMFAKIHSWSVAHAKNMIDAESGDVESHFADYDSNGSIVVLKCTAANYYSMLNPEGPANMRTSVENLNWPANVLVISGERDITQKLFFESIYLNLKIKSNKNKYVLIPDGTHVGVARTKLTKILNWIDTL